ncbi:MAG: hypothetical protein NUV48_01625 [Peptococcaceae bacterium]|jgi:hypothetical protein|nr:hypothetical protein [Peptococcaceae bacterium]
MVERPIGMGGEMPDHGRKIMIGYEAVHTSPRQIVARSLYKFKNTLPQAGYNCKVRNIMLGKKF